MTGSLITEAGLAPREVSEPEVAAVRESAALTVRRAAEGRWSLEDVNWAAVRPENLTADDHVIIRYITFVEDHIPTYLSFNLAAFPTAGQDDVRVYQRNREYFRFLLAWANDEERHACALSQYQLAAEMTDEAGLARELADVGRGSWSLPYADPLEAFIYLFMQEKATQLFYQHYRQAVREPVLKSLLGYLIRDESRHFAFYSRLVEESLHRAGPTTLAAAKNVLANFRMPLDGAFDGYWRMAVTVVDSVGHDHTEAYDALGKLVGRYADTVGTPEAEDLGRLIRAVQRMP
jgi:acyl-[acyl-carrier-protein] desaturase